MKFEISDLIKKIPTKHTKSNKNINKKKSKCRR